MLASPPLLYTEEWKISRWGVHCKDFKCGELGSSWRCDLRNTLMSPLPRPPKKKKRVREDAQMAAWDPEGVRKNKLGGFFISVSDSYQRTSLCRVSALTIPFFWYSGWVCNHKRDLNSRSACGTSFWTTTLHWCQLIWGFQLQMCSFYCGGCPCCQTSTSKLVWGHWGDEMMI